MTYNGYYIIIIFIVSFVSFFFAQYGVLDTGGAVEDEVAVQCEQAAPGPGHAFTMQNPQMQPPAGTRLDLR